MTLHLIKLVVGMDSLDDFARWQEQEIVNYKGGPANIARTRYKPKKADEILDSGGSIYRVIKSHVVCRQKILGFETDENKKRGSHCIILMDTQLIRTRPIPLRAFQGWRYFTQDRAPKDIGPYIIGEYADDSMEMELKELGLL